MAAIKAGDVERAVKARGPEIDLLLFYGRDAGLVSERAGNAARGFVQAADDPFQLIRIDGDALADEPGRLVEEASTFGLFGDRRAIWVKPTVRNIASAVTACLDVPLTDTLVVVEAGDLAKASPLRTLCEASLRALALPCYGDEERDLGAVITATLREHGLTISDDARQVLADSLGGDRLATRGELEKLALYAHGRGSIEMSDVEAVVSDVSGLSVDAVIDAAFAGNRDALDDGLAATAQRGSIGAILPLALRHALALLAARGCVEGGQDTDSALRAWRGLPYGRRNEIVRQVTRWTSRQLRNVTDDIQAAILDGRRSPALSGVTTSRVMMRIAERARQDARSRLQRSSS